MGIYIKDPNYDSSTISQFKADNKGVYFYYELATEITKPVDGNEAIKLLNDKLGNTDISAIGDGTVTGGLDALNSNLGQYGTGIINLFSQNPYTAPSDGFVIAYANPKTINTEGIIVSGTLVPLNCKCVNGNACTSTTLVKKGSRIQVDVTSGLEPVSVCVYVPLHN